jgi:hypothetical protein
MDSNWDFYALLVENQPASIFVDLALASRAPLFGAGHMAYVSVDMRAPRPEGLSSQDEFDDLVAVEQSLEANLSAGAIYAGRCTTAGCRDFYFYVADPEAFASAVAEPMVRHPAYAYRTGHRPDADWSVYREFLHPGPRDKQRIHNRKVVALLEEHGDCLDVPRWIDHCASMPTPASADQLQVALFERGFSVDVQAEAGGGDVTVDFKRIDAPAEIERIVIPVFDLVRSLGGTYDGWGCEVEK